MVEQFYPAKLSENPARHETVVAEGVSFEDFLKTYGEQHAEWLMGKVILVVTNNTIHQQIQTLLVTLLNLFVSYRALGRVLSAGVPMYISDNQPAREPDILVILNVHLDRLKHNQLEGPADIAVEIVSPESVVRDRGDKFAEYQAAGVPEYWLIDPIHHDTNFWALNADGNYEPRPLDAQGRLTSAVLPGFMLDPVLLWRNEPPTGEELVALVQQMLAAPSDQ
jgi:Uma2 family endonuclease